MQLLDQVLGKFLRDRQKLPAYVIWRKTTRYVEELVLSPLYLRRCTRVGRRARMRGRPFIENLGRIEIGDDFNFVSLFVQSHLVTGHAGLLEIGDSVNINFGAAISAHEHVKIGNRVRIGPYSIIMDSDYHTAKDRERRPTAPVVIEDDVWLAGRVSVLRGAHIGKGSVITAGSVVSGAIPAGVVAGGVPARVLGRIDQDDPAVFSWKPQADRPLPEAPPAEPPAASAGVAAAGNPVRIAARAESQARVDADAIRIDDLDPRTQRVKAVIAEAFGLDGPIRLDWSRKDIQKWDSLGTLRLIMSLEERFGISIPESELVNMTSVHQVCRIVHECLGNGG